MDVLAHDVRYGARLLWKHKGFTVTALATLAICIGVNTVAFSVVHSVVLKPLPFPGSDRVLVMYNSYPGAGVERASNGVPDYYDRLQGVPAFEELALYNEPDLTIGSTGSVQQVRGMGVTPSFFRLVQARPLLGRIFTEEEDEEGNQRKAILSFALWQELYGGDASVIGRDIRIYGNPYTIVGVLPQDFALLDPRVRLYRPLAFTAQQKSDDRRHNNGWEMIGRLKPGATLEQVQDQINAINAANLERLPHFREILTNAGFTTRVERLQDEVVRPIRKTLFLLWGGAVFVLLIGVINIANLAVARGSVRLKEIATRAALGAGRGRLARQLLTESLLLTAGGAVLGLLMGSWGLGLLSVLHIKRIPRGAQIGLDLTGVLYVVAMSLLAAVAIGLIPLAQGLRVNLTSVFREDGRALTRGRGGRILRTGLVASQVAFALVLLTGGGLLMASFRQVLAIRPGFVPDQVVTASVALPGARYPDDASLRAFAERALDKVRTLPGIISAGITNAIPFGSDFSDSVILAEGYTMQPGESLISGDNMSVTPGYFEAMRVPLKEGRFFDDRDTADSPRVIIIDERLARKFFPGTSPIGRRMWRPTSPEAFRDPEKGATYYTIVGVVASIKLRALVDAEERVGSYYRPFSQNTDSGLSFAVRTTVGPDTVKAELRRVVRELDPELPLFDALTMQERIDDSLTSRRSPMLLSAGFSAIALLLAAVGLYGVLAYLVALRTREIGIRMALGSDAARVFRLVFREGALIVALGLIAGSACSWMLGRYLESLLFEVRPMDPPVTALAGLALTLVALIATTLPAWRAARVDPVIALRRD
ncbi:MAG: ABC transporter permease [Acidobacteriota bacterium]